MTKQNEYEIQILDWRTAKYRGRVGENGWAALAGLFWLNEGNNLIGSNPVCEVVLPERAPTFLGIIEMKGKTARFQMAQGVRGQINGRMTQKAILKSSKDAKPTFITWNDIRMVLHEHAGRYAVRIWDNQRSERNRLPSPQWFPINKRFCFKAKYTRYKNPQPVSHTDAFGDIVKGKMDGSSTTPSHLAWPTRTPAPRTTRSDTASACSSISLAARSTWESPWWATRHPMDEFLRKATAFFAKENA